MTESQELEPDTFITAELMDEDEPPVFNTRHSTPWHKAIAERGLILMTEVGSGLHGVTVSDQDDVDEMGICIEPADVILGVRPLGQEPFEQYEFRTKPVGVRSGPGDIDRNVYSLRKYCRMAAQGSPTVLMPLFAPEDKIRHIEHYGQLLRANREMFLTKQAGYRFLGYLERQRDLALTKGMNRPELIEVYGYDTKYAYHALRLAIQGTQLMKDHQIVLPMYNMHRAWLLDVRNGRYTRDEVLHQLDRLTQNLQITIEESDLPEWPDYAQINSWLARTYLQWWDDGGSYFRDGELPPRERP